MAAPWYRFTCPGNAGGGISTLLMAEGGDGNGSGGQRVGGTLIRLRVFNCTPQDAAQLTEGRSICVLHAWMTRSPDRWPCLRVDDSASIHFDTTPAALLVRVLQPQAPGP